MEFLEPRSVWITVGIIAFFFLLYFIPSLILLVKGLFWGITILGILAAFYTVVRNMVELWDRRNDLVDDDDYGY